MRAVVQRVKNAKCTAHGNVTGAIDSGLLVYFGVEKDDEESLIEPIIDKIINMRIFPDENYKMNLSIKDLNQAILFISQFTLCANVFRGNRPSFDNAKKSDEAKAFYEKGIELLRRKGIKTEVGEFGAHMELEYLNDGPITFTVDSRDMKKKK